MTKLVHFRMIGRIMKESRHSGDAVKKTVGAVSAGVAAVALLYILLFSQVSAQDLRAVLVRGGAWAPLLYIALFTLLPAVFFPVADSQWTVRPPEYPRQSHP